MNALAKFWIYHDEDVVRGVYQQTVVAPEFLTFDVKDSEGLTL